MKKLFSRTLAIATAIAMLGAEAPALADDILEEIDDGFSIEEPLKDESTSREVFDEIIEDLGVYYGTVDQVDADTAVGEIVGSDVIVESPSYTGGSGQIGRFSVSEDMGLPFNEGIVMSTGYAGSTLGASTYGSLGSAGLDWLTTMYNESGYTGSTNQAAVLDFALTPTSPYLSFDYFFASKEYNQNAIYNDIFALWVIDDMGTDDTSDDEKFNIALLPNNKIVSIQNTVPRSSSGGMAYTSKGDYYTYSGGSYLNGYSFPFLGYTIELTADASNIRNSKNEPVIQVGKRIKLRFAIADARDSAYDSAVFIKANSLNYDSKQQDLTYQPSVRTTTVGAIDETAYISPEKLFGTANGISYTWFQSTDGEAFNTVAGETQSVFKVPTSLSAGTYYYHCIATDGETPQQSQDMKVVVLPTTTTTPIYTVKFKQIYSRSKVGKIPSTFTVAEDGEIPALYDMTLDNYTFGGWYKDSAYTDEFNFASDTITSNMTLYAKWLQIPSYLKISVAPSKRNYYVDDYFTKSGASIYVYYKDGSYNNVTSAVTYDKTAPLTLDDTTVTFSYTENDVTVTATQAITVKERDLTPPEPVTNAKATLTDGAIKVTWTESTSTDTATYKIYRATNSDDFVLLTTVNYGTSSYTDSGIDDENNYTYKIYAVDTSGNVSTTAPECSYIGQDITAPVIKSWTYATGSRLSTSKQIGVFVTDNKALASISLEYKPEGGSWASYGSVTTTQTTSYKAYFATSALSEGTYSFRAKAIDAMGNTSAYSDAITYIIDQTPPSLEAVTATPGEGRITLNWTVSNDVASIVIYRTKTIASSSSRTKVTTITDGAREYVDKDVLDGPYYKYTVIAYDEAGNSMTRYSSTVQTLFEADTESPILKCTLPSTMKLNIDATFDASESTDNMAIAGYSWNFGDGSYSGSAKTTHKYTSTGTFTLTLTITDTSGNQSVAHKKITVVPVDGTGAVNVIVKDNNGNYVYDAGVYFKVGSDDMVQYKTESNGRATISTTPGKYDIGVYKDGYLPAKESVTVENGKTTEVTIIITHEAIVVSDITATKLSAEEIAENGLDPTKEENQNVYKYDVLIAGNNKSQLGTVIIPDEENSSAILTTKITSWDIDGDGDDSLDLSNAYLILIKGDASEGLSDAKALVALVYSPSEASWINDYFNVQMHIMNQADEEFILDDCIATLNCPEGLSIVSGGEGYANSAKYEIGSLQGGHDVYVNWMLRGDVEGTYEISADFTANLVDFNEPIAATFECKEPIKVQVQEGLTLLCETADKVKDNIVYFKMGLKNDRDDSVTVTNFGIDGLDPTKKFIEKESGILITVDETAENVIVPAHSTYWKYYQVDTEVYAAFLNSGLDTTATDIDDAANTLKDAIASSSSNVGIKVDDCGIGTYEKNTVTINGQEIETDPVDVITLPEPTGTEATSMLNDGYQFAGWTEDTSIKELCGADSEELFLNAGSDCVIASDMKLVPIWVGIDSDTGASIRTASPTGLRFNIKMDTDSYNKVLTIDPNAQCGTIIAPYKYLGGNDDNFTIEWLEANNKKYLDIYTLGFAEETPSYKLYRSVIANIKEANYGLDFAARGYLKFKYSNGDEGILYTDFNKDDNVRSVKGVATAALLDTSANYTNAQKAVLQGFAK